MIDAANCHCECVYEGSQWITVFNSASDRLVAYVARAWRCVPALGSSLRSDERYRETNWLEEQALEVDLLTRTLDALWLWYSDRVLQ
jgi:hypothetical protein